MSLAARGLAGGIPATYGYGRRLVVTVPSDWWASGWWAGHGPAPLAPSGTGFAPAVPAGTGWHGPAWSGTSSSGDEWSGTDWAHPAEHP